MAWARGVFTFFSGCKFFRDRTGKQGSVSANLSVSVHNKGQWLVKFYQFLESKASFVLEIVEIKFQTLNILL